MYFLLRNKESENMEIPVVFIDNLKSERWKIFMNFGGAMIVSVQDVEYTDFIYWQETESFINGVASANRKC